MSEAHALLLLAIHAAQQQSTSTNVTAPAGQQRRVPRQLNQELARSGLKLRTWPSLNARRNDPSVEGAYTPPHSSPMPPRRTTSRSSIESAQSPCRPRSWRPCRRRWLPYRSGRATAPARCRAGRTTRPAASPVPARVRHQFGSSNDARTTPAPCSSLTAKVPSRAGRSKRQELRSCQLRRHRRVLRDTITPTSSVDQG